VLVVEILIPVLVLLVLIPEFRCSFRWIRLSVDLDFGTRGPGIMPVVILLVLVGPVVDQAVLILFLVFPVLFQSWLQWFWSWYVGPGMDASGSSFGCLVPVLFEFGSCTRYSGGFGGPGVGPIDFGSGGSCHPVFVP